MGRKKDHPRCNNRTKSKQRRQGGSGNPNQVAPINRASIGGGVTDKRGEETPHVFYLTVPCEPGKPDRVTPLYLVETGKLGKVISAVWQCRECAMIYYTRKAWAKHAGMIPNVMGTCPVMFPPKVEESVSDLESEDYGDEMESWI